MQTRNVAAITMAYGEHYIRKWVDYYSDQFGPENVFAVSHGQSDFHEQVCQGVNHITLPREVSNRIEVHRARFLCSYVNALLTAYRCVLVCDQDEFVLIDPKLGSSLRDYLLEAEPETGVLAPLGFQLMMPETGAPIDWDKDVLSQTRRAVFSSEFSKPCLRWQPVMHSVGAHATLNRKFTVDENLVLLHLKFADLGVCGALDDLAREFDALGEGVAPMLRHWYEGSPFIIKANKEWQARNDAAGPRVMAPQDAVRDLYGIEDYDKGGARVFERQEPVPFKLPESWAALL